MKKSTYLNFGKFSDDTFELIMEILLREFDLSHVEATNSANLVVLVHLSRRFPLSLGEDHIDKFLVGRNDRNTLEVVLGCHCWTRDCLGSGSEFPERKAELRREASQAT